MANVFPDTSDSRVVVTTRKKNVAEQCSWKSKYIYSLEPLSNQDSVNLLMGKINRGKDFFDADQNKHLKNVIDKIIKKCRGLPLAVVATGGLLASKPINEWEKVPDRLGAELETNFSAEAVKQILDLSYTDLPYYLKPCLLYLSIFPEDYEIKSRILVCRWMAEGYVKERRGMTPEEVAEGYFCELINRSLIQPSKVGYDGTIRSCRVHDIMRELIVAKSMDENLISIADENGSGQGNRNFRHLVVHPNSKEVGGAGLPNIRSVSIFNGPVPNILSSFHSKSKLLRVVDMRFMNAYWYDSPDYDTYEQFFKHVQQFVHLKYLSVGRSVSFDVENFRNLQTLELRYIDG